MASNLNSKGQTNAAIFTLIIIVLVSIVLIVLLYMTNPGIFGNLAYLMNLTKAAPTVSPSQAEFTAYNCINTPCAPFGQSYSSDMWTLDYGGSTQTEALNSPIEFTVYNGTYTLAAQAVYVGGQYEFLCPHDSNSDVYYNYSVPSGNSYKIYFYPCTLETTTFTETGLPSGQEWNMTYDGIFKSTTSNSIEFQVPIFKYAFSINKSNGYEPNPVEGILQSGQTQAIAFTPTITYLTTTFYSGLAQYAFYYPSNWTLVYDGITGTNYSIADPIHILTSNDQSQSYPVTAYINGYVCYAKASSVAVGSTYTFSNWNCRTLFSESGLPINKNWNLTYDGVFNDSTKSIIPINTSAGYYKFSYFIPQKIPTNNQQQQSVNAPQNIEYYIPVTITNSQSSATPTPFQQEIIVNSANYQNYEASNLQNIEFFNANGQIIPSWLESGASSSSTQTIYWLKLANSIPAGGSITIYMGFASTATNLFNGNTVGEAPALSPIYGEYDDGADVFNYYQKFGSLSSLPNGWSMLPGVSVSYYPNYITLMSYITSGWTGIYTTSNQAMTSFPSIIEWYGNEYDDSTGWIPYREISAGTTVGLTTNTLGQDPAYALDEGFSGVDPYLTYIGNDNIQFYESTNYQDTNTYKIYGLYISNPYSASFYTNYSLEYSTSNLASTSSSYVLVGVSSDRVYQCFYYNGRKYCGWEGASSSMDISWVRVRSYPPNGVMPTVSFGGVQTPQQSLNTPPCYYSTSSTATNNETEAGSSSNIIYYSEYCPVMFYQNTLPQGIDWSVTMNGNQKTWTPSSGATGTVENLTFYALNNTVASFTVPTVSTQNCKYTPTPSSGSINVGKQFSQEVSYTSSCQMTYTIFKNTATTGGTAYLTYSVTNPNTFVVIMIGAGWFDMSGVVSLPQGCTTQQDATGPDNYETAYIATCIQNPGTYTVSVEGNQQTYFSMAAYVFSPGQYTFSTNSATSTSSSISTTVNPGYSLYLCDGGAGDYSGESGEQFTISGTNVVSNSPYSAVSQQTNNVCSASTNNPDLAIAGIGISMQGYSPPPPSGAPTLDTYISGNGGSSFTITTSQPNELILIDANGWAGYTATGANPSVTVNGNAATEVASEGVCSNPGISTLFDYIAKNPGVYTISIGEDGYETPYYLNFAAAFENANPNGIGYSVNCGETQYSVSTSISAASNEIIFATATYNTGQFNEGIMKWNGVSGLDELHEGDGLDSGIAYTTTSSAGTYQITAYDNLYTSSSGETIIAVAIP